MPQPDNARLNKCLHQSQYFLETFHILESPMTQVNWNNHLSSIFLKRRLNIPDDVFNELHCHYMLAQEYVLEFYNRKYADEMFVCLLEHLERYFDRLNLVKFRKAIEEYNAKR